MKSWNCHTPGVRVPGLMPGFFFFILSVALSACAAVPYARIQSVHRSRNSLYLIAKPDEKTSAYIKILDARTFALVDKLELGRSGDDIVSALQDGDDLILVVRESQQKYFLYRLEAGKPAHKLGMISPYVNLISGADQDFFYAVSTADKKAQGVYIGGMRYDKTLKSQMMNHFDENPDLVVIGVSEDDNAYWYVCLERRVVDVFSSISELGGRLVLVEKSKDRKEYKRFEYPGGLLRNLYSTADEENVWIFASAEAKESKGRSSDPEIIRFSKEGRKFETNRSPMPLIPFPHQRLASRSDYLWTLGYDNRIVRVSKKDLNWAATSLPSHMTLYSGGQRTPAFFSTDDSLLIGAYDYENKTYKGSEEAPTPYILKYSKADMQYERIPVGPTTGEAIETGATNAFIGVYRGCCLNPLREYEKHDYQ